MIKDSKGKPGEQWEYFSSVKKLISFEKLCCSWKTSQPNDKRLKRKTR